MKAPYVMLMVEGGGYVRFYVGEEGFGYDYGE